MNVHLNFGNVINTYVNNIFPHSGTFDQKDDSTESNVEEDTPHDIPLHHKIAYSSFVVLILVFLLLLCIITVNIKSVFMTNKSLNYAITDIISPNTNGFLHMIDQIHNEPDKLVSELNVDEKDSKSTVKNVLINLTHQDHITNIDKLKTRTDIALWIQFGLIPNLFQNLNTFNQWVTKTIQISFKGRNNEYKHIIPNDVLSKSNVVLHSKPSLNNKDEAENGRKVFYSYLFDQKKSVNYQYINGEDLDEILSKLMQGTGYLSEHPYFPLNSIISDKLVDEIILDFIVNNVLSNVISYVNLKFSLKTVENVINGENIVESKIDNKLTVSSYRINTTLFPLIIDAVLILFFIANLIYTIIMYKRHYKSFFLFDYIFDSIFKISVFLCLIFFNAIVLYANYGLPRLGKKSCESGFCICEIVLGYNNIPFDYDKLMNLSFDSLIIRIRVSVVLFGLLCFFIMLGVISSLISTWLVINKHKQLSLIYKKYYYHLKIPLLSLLFGIGISTLLISVFNSSVSHMFKSSMSSITDNFFALFNLILGISNDATLKYIDNYSVIYSIIFITLLFISFYFAVILITSLLLMFDHNEKTLDFSVRPVSWKYDNYRIMVFITRLSRRYSRFKRFFKSKIFRMKAYDQGTTKIMLKSQLNQSEISGKEKYDEDLDDENKNKKNKVENTKKKWFCFSFNFNFSFLFSISFLSVFKTLTYLAMAGCIVWFIYCEYGYLKVSRVISKTIEESVFRDKYRWKFDLKFYKMKYSELVQDNDLTPANHTMNATIVTTLPNSKITNYSDLYEWLDDGNIKSLFRWIDTSKRPHLPQHEPKIVGINSRYYIHPKKSPVLLGLSFYRTPPQTMVEKLKKILFHIKYYQMMTFTENTCGLRSIFDIPTNTIPDIVDKVELKFLMVDSLAKNKIYNGCVQFYMEMSGMMAFETRVFSVFSLFVPSTEKTIFLYIILGCSCLLLAFLLTIMSKDIYNFKKGYRMYYPHSSVIYMIMMYFFNDIRRVFDLLVIGFVICIISTYSSIFTYLTMIKNKYYEMEDLYYRYLYQVLSKRILYIHSSLVILLGLIILFGFILKNKTTRHYLYVGISVLYQMKYLYANIVFYFLVIVFTFLFFFYFISKDYFTDFIKGNKFFKRCMRLILHDHQFFGDFKNMNLTELILYPLCLTFKIWLTNVIFYHLWSVWPRFDYSKKHKNYDDFDFLDDPDELEEKFKNADLEITSITQEQLDVLPREVKQKAAQETLNLFNRFKEYNKKYIKSGKNRLKFIETLHDELGDEMNDLLDISNKLEFKVGIVSKESEVLQDKSHKDLEEQISILEECLEDKREELNAVFAEYNSKIK